MKRKWTALCLVAAMLAPTAVFADAVQVGNGQQVEVTGTTDEKNTPVSIEVYKKGKTAQNLVGMDKADYTTILVCHDQTTTDAKGAYKFTFEIDDASGDYTVLVSTATKDLPQETLVYANITQFKEMAQKIKTISQSEIAQYIAEDPALFGWSEEDMTGLKAADVAAVTEATLQSYTIDPEDRQEFLKIAEKILLVSKLNAGLIQDIFAEKDEVTEIATGDLKDWYKKDYVTAELKKDVNAKLSKQNLASYKKYKERLTEAFILATVHYPNGTSNIKDIMGAFEAQTGISTSGAKSTTWSTLAGKDYADYAALKSAYNAAQKGNTTQSGGQVGGGSNKDNSGSSNKGLNSVVGGVPVAKDKSEEVLPAITFNDLDSVEWAQEAILRLAENKIISGYGDGRFGPNDQIKREEFVKIIVSAFLDDEEEADISFADVAADAWYAPYLKKAFGAGVVNGISETEFGVGMPITRQDLCVMVYNAALKAGKINEIETPQELFDDDDQIADYAKKAVYTLRANEVVNGLTDTEFVPAGNATRAQAARIINGLLD